MTVDFFVGWVVFVMLFGPVIATLLVLAGIGLLFWGKLKEWMNPSRED